MPEVNEIVENEVTQNQIVQNQVEHDQHQLPQNHLVQNELSQNQLAQNELVQNQLAQNKLELRNRIVDQQFWFTATIMGVNAFLISTYDKVTYNYFTFGWITFINVYTIYLLVHRSASHAYKTTLPAKLTRKPQSERGFLDKFKETLFNFKVSIKHIPFIIGEFSGTLFYILLVVTSYVAFTSICKFK